MVITHNHNGGTKFQLALPLPALPPCSRVAHGGVGNSSKFSQTVPSESLVGFFIARTALWPLVVVIPLKFSFRDRRQSVVVQVVFDKFRPFSRERGEFLRHPSSRPPKLCAQQMRRVSRRDLPLRGERGGELGNRAIKGVHDAAGNSRHFLARSDGGDIDAT
ncbi:hypothetical protein IYW41_15240 [Methylocystis sp. H15]|uniref:hypothetical protein n=1 Tax=unclassified Methylocystis TaxID=2625913 RepID=UPI0018C2E679|nr:MULTISPECIES: hypothetical protein [unclassified Methylocystis]MBG0806950.1 hypothetical protein [Methylocystis sp. H15]